MTNVLFIRDAIYRLKQDYGTKMDLYVTGKTDINLATGEQTVVKKKYTILQVVLLPELLQRRYVQDIAYLAANKNFTYGALFDEGKRVVILGKGDVPKGVKLDPSCYFVFDHVRYAVDKFDELEHKQGYILTMKKFNTEVAYEIIDLKAESVVQYQQDLVGTI
jgi:hypothetical protein